MRYYVVAEDGNKYGPANVATLNSWIQEGRLIPGTLLEEEGSGARVVASAVSGLTFPTPASASIPPSPSYTQPPGSSAQNPYGTGYANPYQAPPTASNTETIIAWIMGVLSLFLLCCGVGWLFSGIGLVLAIVGKNKGDKGALAAMIFNIVVLVLSLLGILLLLLNIKQITHGFPSSQPNLTNPSFTPPQST